jgi:hypothetical protein
MEQRRRLVSILEGRLELFPAGVERLDLSLPSSTTISSSSINSGGS